jgi:ADP-ribose pyrophosphatase YjhB (NUDIX family)
MPTPAQWLEWVRRLQSVAQTGLEYAKDPYDRQRYEEIRRIAANIGAKCDGLPDAKPVLKLFENETGYATPKVDIRTAVFDQNKVLLVKERSDGLWTLPGGWADVGESPALAALREVREESGYEVVIKKLAAVLDRDKYDHPQLAYHVYKLFFIGELRGGIAAHSIETSGVEFFREDQLPPLSLTRVIPEQIRHMFEHFRNPTLPTSFD